MAPPNPAVAAARTGTLSTTRTVLVVDDDRATDNARSVREAQRNEGCEHAVFGLMVWPPCCSLREHDGHIHG